MVSCNFLTFQQDSAQLTVPGRLYSSDVNRDIGIHQPTARNNPDLNPENDLGILQERRKRAELWEKKRKKNKHIWSLFEQWFLREMLKIPWIAKITNKSVIEELRPKTSL